MSALIFIRTVWFALKIVKGVMVFVPKSVANSIYSLEKM